MTRTFGRFVEMAESPEYLIISFSSTTLPIHERWRNNSLSADFLANYWGAFFPVHNTMSSYHRAEVQDTVSYISNELLENAIKFSYEPSGLPIRIGIYLVDDLLRFYVTNSVNPQAVGPFQEYIQRLLTEDPGDLYIQQVESNARDEESPESRLGFLTLLNDYDARLAWKFDTIQQNPEIIVVTTMVELGIVRTQQHQKLQGFHIREG
jgi:hypothetical protein